MAKIIDVLEITKEHGGKAVGLNKLCNWGVVVPQFFVIENSVCPSINFRDELSKKLLEFHKDVRLVVRSSATAEDGTDKSFAGIFKTILNVENNVDEVLVAMKKVNASTDTEISNAYSTLDKKMNIVVQKQIDAKYSGVAFTKAIDIDGKEILLIECVEGMGEKLVSGKITATTIKVPLVNTSSNLTYCEIQGNPLNFGFINTLVNEIQKIIKQATTQLDLEWCVDENDAVYIVQARPITADILVKERLKNEAIIASAGYVNALSYVINEKDATKSIQQQVDDFIPGSILVADVTETQYMPAIAKSSGIITQEGSALSHAAIVSRELGIPCIVNYKNAIAMFPTGTQIELDANNGTIKTSLKTVDCNAVKAFVSNELLCFDCYQKIIVENVVTFVEATFDGIVLHLPNGINAETLKKIDMFYRQLLNQKISIYMDDKYWWYLELERFLRLPCVRDEVAQVKRLVENENFEEIEGYYQSMLIKLNKLVGYKKSTTDKVIRLIIDEYGAAFNLLLDAMLPLGYALRTYSLKYSFLLKQNDMTFNDLFSNNIAEICDKKEILRIQKLVQKVADLRNKFYSRILEIDGTNQEYFNGRANKIKEILKERNMAETACIEEQFYDIVENTDKDEIISILKCVN
ncbi:MAG: hypothetical protein LBH62_09850 [Nitrososphaerota archaeon]|jgi:pyruvate,water dikinase|nr:hypothetical protein [Nitrososphaerota archaeon]